MMHSDKHSDNQPKAGRGATLPLLIAGPCVLEDPGEALETAEALAAMATRQGFRFVFKASFDKANRSSIEGFRGPGLREGLRILGQIRSTAGVRLLTDIHAPSQAEAAAEVVDVLQIPAFLCRQTDLLLAAAATGKTVNWKKGQFLAPSAVGPALGKLRSAGAKDVWLTERGTSFGHGDLVVDYRGLAALRATGCPVIFDATHAVQRPGAHGDHSGGQRELVPLLSRAAAAAGFDGLFLEVHPAPERAKSDRDSQWPLDRCEELLKAFAAIHRAASPHVEGR